MLSSTRNATVEKKQCERWEGDKDRWADEIKPFGFNASALSRPSEGANAAMPSPPDAPPCSAVHRLLPISDLALHKHVRTHGRTHAHIHLSFAISICGHAIYLASGECPSATQHNISHKYQLSGRGSWNIYEGNMAACVFSSVYGEHCKVQQVPANFSKGSHFAWATGALLATALLLQRANLWWSRKAFFLIPWAATGYGRFNLCWDSNMENIHAADQKCELMQL